MKIIVVEDNEDLCQELVFLLNKSGHEARGVSSATELDRCMAAEMPDILLLDISLPGEDGLSIARRLRTRPQLGIVMLTAHGSDEDHIRGLEDGADNYLVKPVNRGVLLAVLERVYNRLHPQDRPQGNSWRLLRREHLLITPGGGEIPLTDTELVLIEAMVRNPGKACHRRQLVEALGYDFMTYDERRLEVRISRLRKKIRELNAGEEPLKSEWGVGYLFAAACELH